MCSDSKIQITGNWNVWGVEENIPVTKQISWQHFYGVKGERKKKKGKTISVLLNEFNRHHKDEHA